MFRYWKQCDFKESNIIYVTCVYDIATQILKPYIRFVFESNAFR